MPTNLIRYTDMKKIILMTLFLPISFLLADGAKLYNEKCATCHGKDGSEKAMRKSNPILGMSEKDVMRDLEGYKAGKLNKHGMAGLMRAQVRTYTPQQIKEVSAYIATLKKKKNKAD